MSGGKRRATSHIMTAMGNNPAISCLIREYRRGDLTVLHQIDIACFEPGISFSRSELLFHLYRPGAVSKVVESDGIIIGFAVGCRPDAASGYVITIDVLQDMRRKAVGSALMEALHDAFRKSGARISYLDVDEKNIGAVAFYERLGYKPIGIREGYYRGERDAVRMARALV